MGLAPGKSLGMVALAALVVASHGCGSSADGDGSQNLLLEMVTPSTVVPGTNLIFYGDGFPTKDVGSLRIRLSATWPGGSASHSGEAVVLDQRTAELALPLRFIEAIQKAPNGASCVAVAEALLTQSGHRTKTRLSFTLTAQLTLNPILHQISPTSFSLGEQILVHGHSLLLPSEGALTLLFAGSFQPDNPAAAPLEVSYELELTAVDRTLASAEVPAELFSVLSGRFSGTVQLVNRPHLENLPETTSEPLTTSLQLTPPFIQELFPEVVRRGQYLYVRGGGFLPPGSKSGAVTLLELEGEFTDLAGGRRNMAGRNSLLLFPEESRCPSLMRMVLRAGGGAEGGELGREPGQFRGVATPVVYFGDQEQRGVPFPVELTVARPLQVVYLKFLESFDMGFQQFGLWEARHLVKQRLVEKAQGFYDGVNLRFVTQRPTAFAEYSVIEMAGEDPNGKGLLGLDNTVGKDDGNLRFDDVIGGKNAETRERGYYAYGGIFINSFMGFSPTLANGTEALASDRFDDIFGPFAPPLGGLPATEEQVAELVEGDELWEAIRVLSNLLGGTLAHEIGHSLGLAYVPERPAEYHNSGDNPGWLMDAGKARPFLERAELDGHGPEFFGPPSMEYLLRVLPPDDHDFLEVLSDDESISCF